MYIDKRIISSSFDAAVKAAEDASPRLFPNNHNIFLCYLIVIIIKRDWSIKLCSII